MNSTVGERLKERRKALRMSQQDLAAALKVDQSTVAHWERGRSSLTSETIEMLAGLLKMDPAVLAFGQAAFRTAPVVGVVREGQIFLDETGGTVMAPPVMAGVKALRVESCGFFSVGGGRGFTIYFEDVGQNPADALANRWPCVIELADGRLFCGCLYFGEQRGLFTVETFQGEPIRNVEVQRISLITWIAMGPPLSD